MSKHMQVLRIVVGVFLTVSLAGCVFDSVGDSETASPDPSESASTAPPEIDYSTEAGKMRSWDDDFCHDLEVESVIEQFDDPIPEIRSENKTQDEDFGYLKCFTDIDTSSHGRQGRVELLIEPYDNNTEAWESYPGRLAGMIDGFFGPDVEPEQMIDVSGGAWVQGTSVSLDTPNVSTEEERLAIAVVNGDFYLAMIFVYIDPDDAFRAGCEPSGADECLMTAEFMAEYLAEQYLPSLHQAIEDRLSAG